MYTCTHENQMGEKIHNLSSNILDLGQLNSSKHYNKIKFRNTLNIVHHVQVGFIPGIEILSHHINKKQYNILAELQNKIT